MLRDGQELPARVATLDELLLIVQEMPAFDSTLIWDSICMEPISAFRQANEGGRGGIGAQYHHDSQRLDCRRCFSPALKYSPGNGGTGCRSPRRVRSSIPAARFTFSATPGNGRDRLLSRRNAFVGAYRKPSHVSGTEPAGGSG